jgi:hypothetical protein
MTKMMRDDSLRRMDEAMADGRFDSAAPLRL